MTIQSGLLLLLDATYEVLAGGEVRRIGLWSDPHPTPPWDFRHGTPTKLCFNKADRRIECSAAYQGRVRGNRRSHIYQWPGCPYYDSTGENNRVEFPNAAGAEAAGFRAARNCP